MRSSRAGAAGLAAIGAITVIYTRLLALSNATTVALTFLLVVLVVAAASTLRAAVATSIAAVLMFNYFFLPPVGTFTIADPQNWVALAVFLAVSLIASNLSAKVRTRADEAEQRRNEMARLFDISRDVLLMTDSREALSHLARSLARRIDLDYVGIALPVGGDWEVAAAGLETIVLDRRELATAFAAAETRIEFDASQRTYAGQREVQSGEHVVRLIPLRAGTRPVGLLAVAGVGVDAGTLDALAGIMALAVERARFLEERKAAALTRQSEELKTALLASLGHDLRTPLTAIRLATTNLMSSDLSPGDRAEQAALIHAEVQHLTRLFNNVLEMARLDAGAVAAATRAVHPSEIIAAARDQVAQTLRHHPVDVDIDDDRPVHLDPRLTATALAHVLENAAQYTPEGSPIVVFARRSSGALEISVRDRGAGISRADLPHLFDRFYRGAAAQARASGTGMGLWIARGLLAAAGGRIWAENNPDRGATFTINVPNVPISAAAPSSPHALGSST
jgi:two-component system sensor histidine kinase KdpD